jgi:hypothetical protein
VNVLRDLFLQFLLNIHFRDGPFNFQGGGYGFFSKKNILIPNVSEKVF